MHRILVRSTRTPPPTAPPPPRGRGRLFVCCLLPTLCLWMASASPSSPLTLASFVPGIIGGSNSKLGITAAGKGRRGRNARCRPRWVPLSVVGGGGGGGEEPPSPSSPSLPSSPRKDPDEKKPAEKDVDDVAQSYHLVHSPGFPLRVALYSAAIAFLRLLLLWISSGRTVTVTATASASAAAASCHNVPQGAVAGVLTSSSVAKTVANRVVLPLLSSACCAVQLLLNSVLAASGCAGFNTYLGPLRPFFLALLINVTVTGGYRAGFFRSGRWVATAVASWTVALLPEIVHWRNSRLRKRYSTTTTTRRRTTEAGADPVGARKNEVVVSLAIPSMGCVACVQKVSSSLRSSSRHVIQADSWLVDAGDDAGGKGGRARVVVDVTEYDGDGPVPSVEDVGNVLVDVVRGAGFTDCQVESFKGDGEGEEARIDVSVVGGD